MIYRLIVEHSHGKSLIDGGCNDQNIYTLAICLWGPQTIANLAYTTQFTMVYGTNRYSWWDLDDQMSLGELLPPHYDLP